MILTGTFQVLIDGTLHTYNNYEDVPQEFDDLITCNFDYKEGPHTPEEHEELHRLNDYFKALQKREKRYASSN